MKYCPIISFQKERCYETECMGEGCAFADAAGQCLIGQALECYVSRERSTVAAADLYELTTRNGEKTPINFNPYSYSYTSYSTNEYINRNYDFVGPTGLQEGT